jgi:hypothetical protein
MLNQLTKQSHLQRPSLHQRFYADDSRSEQVITLNRSTARSVQLVF